MAFRLVTLADPRNGPLWVHEIPLLDRPQTLRPPVSRHGIGIMLAEG